MRVEGGEGREGDREGVFHGLSQVVVVQAWRGEVRARGQVRREFMEGERGGRTFL
jgi:hypothetical protein